MRSIVAGRRPDNLGVTARNLLACPSSPNCVSTQAASTTHRMEAIPYVGSVESAVSKLRALIEYSPRACIIEQEGPYIHAEFVSRIMGFVDDVEFFVDESTSEVHFRSASRLGRWDMGVNRKRMEQLTTDFQNQESLAGDESQIATSG